MGDCLGLRNGDERSKTTGCSMSLVTCQEDGNAILDNTITDYLTPISDPSTNTSVSGNTETAWLAAAH